MPDKSNVWIMLQSPIYRIFLRSSFEVIQAQTSALRYPQQLYFKYEGGSSRDARLREFPVTHFSRQVYFPFVTDTHLLHGNDPSFYELVESECDWYPSAAAVKFLSVNGPAGIVCCNDTSWNRVYPVISAFAYYFVIYPFRQGFYSFFLGLCCQPVPVCLYVFAFSHNVPCFSVCKISKYFYLNSCLALRNAMSVRQLCNRNIFHTLQYIGKIAHAILPKKVLYFADNGKICYGCFWTLFLGKGRTLYELLIVG